MFPNHINPLFAPFMAERAKALSKYISVDIVAPVAYVPFLRNTIPPLHESYEGLYVNHPRYLGVPSFYWHYRWIPHYLMCATYRSGMLKNSDLVHIEWIYPDAYAFLCYARKFHIKTVGVVHGNEAIGYYEQRSHRKYYIKALKGLDRIIAVSSDLKRKMAAEYDVPEDKIAVIPNGADLKKFPIIDKHKARHALALPLDVCIGVCVARLSPEKNLDILIEAISLLGHDAPMICIIGDGPLQTHLESLREQYNVKAKVKLIGPVPHNEIYQWLNAADFFCLPSQKEGCPVVIHEALACGLPVISTNVGAIPEQICCNDYGLLCPPSDPKALSILISKTMKISWDREVIASYGRQFTWDSVAQQTIKVFEEVLG